MKLSRRAFLRGRLPSPMPQRTTPAPGVDAVAFILPERCLAGIVSFCTTCSERCPVPGAVTVEMGRPRINPLACNGCGECVKRCPAPQPAIQLHPRMSPRAPRR